MSIQAITRAIPPIPGEESNVTNGSDSRSTTQDVVASATASVTNGSDSISTTQDVVASATAMSSDTQATSKKASRIRKCGNRMTSVFRQTKQNKTERLASDLVKIRGLVDVVSGLKESNLHSQNIISEYVRQNPIGCMSVPEAEQLADYILKISQANIKLTKKIGYFKLLLTDFDYPEGFTMRPEVYNVLPVFVKAELCCQVDKLIRKYQCAIDNDKTLLEIKAQGLSDQEFAIEFIHKLNQATKELITYNRIDNVSWEQHVQSSC